MTQTLLDRIAAPGPKKILACDGGGIRGLMSVEILSRIEADLRAAYGRPGLVLADFFDFTCGTSTGAIISACISAGMSTADIRAFYVGSGKEMFDRAFVLKRLSELGPASADTFYQLGLAEEGRFGFAAADAAYARAAQLAPETNHYRERRQALQKRMTDNRQPISR